MKTQLAAAGVLSLLLTDIGAAPAPSDLGSVLSVPAGRSVTYETSIRQTLRVKGATESPDHKAQEQKLVTRFVVLDRNTEDGLAVLSFTSRLDGNSAAKDKVLTKENAEQKLLALGSVWRTATATASEACAPRTSSDSRFSRHFPLPNPKASSVAGEVIETAGVQVPSGYLYDSLETWTTSAVGTGSEALLRVEGSAKTTPVTRPGGGDQLESFNEIYWIDPAVGIVKSFEIHWTVRHADGCEQKAATEEIKMSGTLQSATELDSVQIQSLRAEHGLGAPGGTIAPKDYTELEGNKPKK